jgi:hypothetical protein
VKCAAQFGIQACARAGRHGFNNRAGCTDGLLVDVADLQDYQLDHSSRILKFGSGWWGGGVQYKLAHEREPLAISTGPVNSVGGGLILGCGRGLLTSMYGLACDWLLGVEYIDASGHFRVANQTENADMYWLARGGGGEFPGIVTSFIMQAFPMPTNVYSKKCEYSKDGAKGIAKEWARLQEDVVQPHRKACGTMVMWSHGVVSVKIACYSCNSAQQRWVDSTVDAISRKASGGANCKTSHRSWLDELLVQAGVDNNVVHPKNKHALQDRNQGWGPHKPGGMRVGGRNGYSYDIPWDVLNTINHHVFVDPASSKPWSMYVGWYTIAGPMVENIPRKSTAYGHRDAKWNIHWKITNADGDYGKDKSRAFQHALDRLLPCKNFYNYLDSDMTCATNDDDWLEAHFSDVPRLKSVQRNNDPNNVFRKGCSGSIDRLHECQRN